MEFTGLVGAVFAPESDTPAKLGFPRRSAARLIARPEGAASSPRANGLESKKPQSTRACAAFEIVVGTNRTGLIYF
jgi:hypothetical protein